MTHSYSQGFVVLFTILISSIVLLMALGITNIATKEITLSIQTRDAARAFFAADAGMECALYQDRVAGTFSGTLAPFQCNDLPVSVLDDTSPVYTFYASVGVNNDSCVKVEIDKAFNGGTQTRITALGYNTQFDGLNLNCGENTSNARRIERGYRATY